MKLGPYELNTVILGDCLEVMGPIPDNSIDSIVTDPPYGLGDDPDIADLLYHWLNDKDYDTGPGFMQRDWDVVPGPAVWRECYRVMKPGGCLMAFGGTRTCDLLSIAIRLAGFQRFDQIVWLTGQGFAKGADVSKKLDAMAGMEREVIGETIRVDGRIPANEKPQNLNGNIYQTGIKDSSQRHITAPATEVAALWSGWKSQLKPSHEVILCFWKPREKTFANNALKYGVAGLNIDECRIPTNGEVREREDTTNEENGAINFNTSKKIVNVSKDWKLGRFPSNVLLSHHPDCVRIGVKKVSASQGGYERKAQSLFVAKEHQMNNHGYADPDGLETVEAWECVESCPILQLDRQAGVRKSGGGNGQRKATGRTDWGMNAKKDRVVTNGIEPSSGSATRFFYCPKAPPREKWFFCEICDDVYPYAERDDHAHGKPKGQRKHQIAHPTVKPLAICNFTLGVLEYLCRLTKTPTGGIVLDPFAGSGTTALAAIANGRPFLLIENDPIYHRIAQKRIEQAMKEPRQLELL